MHRFTRKALALAAAALPALALPAQFAGDYQTIGLGCPGPFGTPANVAPVPPRVGASFTFYLLNLPIDVAILGISFQRHAPPLDLTSFGAPGCRWHVAAPQGFVLFGSQHIASFSLAIPNDPAWVGVQFYTQALVPDPFVLPPNHLKMTASDAAQATIGS